MSLAARLRYRWWTRARHPARYANLLRAIRERRARSLVEVGVWDGVHARQMIETAALSWPRREISYTGFDLFESLTDEQLAAEFSKRPPPLAVVRARLEATGAAVRLVPGDTRTTLHEAAPALAGTDLVYLDGGHAVETIASDWSAIERFASDRTTIILDDYYEDPAPELAGFGCQSLVDSLDRARWDVELLEPVDSFLQPWGTLRIRFARVRRRP
jgi:hypothetical protein